MAETIWSRIVAKKYYVIFVLVPTFIWLWGSIISMFKCCVSGDEMDHMCRAGFWAAGGAAPFHVFTVHVFSCLIYPSNILVARNNTAGCSWFTYGLVFVAPFVAPLGVLWMYFACDFSAIAVRMPFFMSGMLFLIITGYVPLFLLYMAKRRSDKIKNANKSKLQSRHTVIASVSSEVSSSKSYQMPSFQWWKHPLLYMYTEGGDTVNLVNDLITNTWIYNSQIGRDAFNMNHSGLLVQEVHWVCNRRLINIYTNKRDEDLRSIPNLECTQDDLDLSARIKQSILSLKVSSLAEALRRTGMEHEETIESVKHSDHASALRSKEQPIETLTQGPIPLRDDEVYLFHGTKKRHAQSIIEEGLDIHRSRDGLYGKGIYLTESSQKADQYSDSPSKRKRKSLTMFIVRTRLCKVQEWNKRRPYFEAEDEEAFDTLVAGYGKRFREFVVKHSANCFPEFLVIYKRKFESDFI